MFGNTLHDQFDSAEPRVRRSEVGGGSGGQAASLVIQKANLRLPEEAANDGASGARSQRFQQDLFAAVGQIRLSKRTIVPKAITLPPNAPAALQPIS